MAGPATAGEDIVGKIMAGEDIVGRAVAGKDRVGEARACKGTAGVDKVREARLGEAAAVGEGEVRVKAEAMRQSQLPG